MLIKWWLKKDESMISKMLLAVYNMAVKANLSLQISEQILERSQL